MSRLFNTEIVREGTENQLPILAFVYDSGGYGLRRRIRKEFIHDKDNKNYDYNYRLMLWEIDYKRNKPIL